jgi:SAM-dependent methyltransferase
LNRNKIIAYFLKKYPIGKEFLELGCGSAFVLNFLVNEYKNLSFTGSEIYIEGLKLAQKRLSGRAELIQFDATKINFNEKFDGIGAFDVLEHIENDKIVLENIYKSLKPNGRVFISVPQHMFMWSVEDDLAFHKRRYSKDEINDKLVQAGFKVEFLTSYMFLLFPIMLINRYIKKNKKGGTKKLFQELYPGKLLNSGLNIFAYLDFLLIKLGLRLPWGGSLFVVGIKVNKED